MARYVHPLMKGNIKSTFESESLYLPHALNRRKSHGRGKICLKIALNLQISNFVGVSHKTFYLGDTAFCLLQECALPSRKMALLSSKFMRKFGRNFSSAQYFSSLHLEPCSCRYPVLFSKPLQTLQFYASIVSSTSLT